MKEREKGEEGWRLCGRNVKLVTPCSAKMDIDLNNYEEKERKRERERERERERVIKIALLLALKCQVFLRCWCT